jgi:hypothetical protein
VFQIVTDIPHNAVYVTLPFDATAAGLLIAIVVLAVIASI